MTGNRNIKLTIEYDGTGYHGWQTQKNAITVQEVMERSLEKLLGHKVSLIGASRTDVGVHALGQVANFRTDSKIPADKFPFAINPYLPPDITVRKAEDVPEDFHARFSAKGKTYYYLIDNRTHPPAILRNQVYHYPYKLDMEAMQKACGYLTGTHDFQAFMASGASVKTTVRTLYSCSIRPVGDLLRLSVSGNGFLYNMVRILTGTVLEVGRKKIMPEDVLEILTQGDRKAAGVTVPACGLYLVEVYY